MKKLIALLLAVVLVVGLTACATAAPAPAAAEEPAAAAAPAETEAPAAPAMLKVGIINNPPAESGYRAANVADMEKVFSEANGYG